MSHIAIISGSVRDGRKSHQVAEYLKKYIADNTLSASKIVDLKELKIPMLEDVQQVEENPSSSMQDFKSEIIKADAVIVIAPEYNGSYPATLKNAIDLFSKSFYRKPIGLVGVSTGDFGGVHAIVQLQSLFFKIKAFPSTIMPISRVDENIDEQGVALQKERIDKRAGLFMKELLWVTEAFSRMPK